MSELTQFDSEKSMIRYLPPNGTAGFGAHRGKDRAAARPLRRRGSAPSSASLGPLLAFACGDLLSRVAAAVTVRTGFVPRHQRAVSAAGTAAG